MAKYENPKSILGLKPWIVGSSEAPRLHGHNVGYGQKYDKAPRFKNQFFVHFQFAPQVSFNTGNDFVKGVSYRVISFDAPKFDIETETLNQYNKRRIVPTKINFSPVNISFHDDKTATVQSFWTFIYEYYFKDGAYGTGEAGQKTPVSYTVDTSTKINEEIDRGLVKTALPYDYFGYNLHNKETQPNLFKFISLYLVANQKYTRIDLVNPYLTNFAHDTFSQEEHSSHAQLTTTWTPETVVYVVDNKAIETGDEKLKSFLGFDTQGTSDKSIFNHYSVDESPVGEPGATDFSVNQVNEPANTKITFVKRPDPGISMSTTDESVYKSAQTAARAAGEFVEKLIQTKIPESIDIWKIEDVALFEASMNKATDKGVDNLVSQAAVASSIQGLFPGMEIEQTKKLAKSMINAAIPRVTSLISNSSTGAVDTIISNSPELIDKQTRDTPVAEDFAELEGDLNLINTPSPKASQGMQDAMSMLQKGKTAEASGLATALSLATSVANLGSLGRPSAPVAGEAGSLLGGMATLARSPSPPMSRIGRGSLLVNTSGLGASGRNQGAVGLVNISGLVASELNQGAAGLVNTLGLGASELNQGLPGLNAISRVVNISVGGGSFGHFSTGASTLGNIAQALASANLRQIAIAVGRAGGIFAPRATSVPLHGQRSGLGAIDVIMAINALSRRGAGSNLNNSVVSSSRTAAKPWVNPDAPGLKTIHTGFVTTNNSLSSGVFNNTFGPQRVVQNRNIRGW